MAVTVVEPGPKRALVRRRWVVLATACFTAFVVAPGYGIVVPPIPSLTERRLPESRPAELLLHTGGLTGVYMVAIFVFAPIWGYISPIGSGGARWPLPASLAMQLPSPCSDLSGGGVKILGIPTMATAFRLESPSLPLLAHAPIDLSPSASNCRQ